MIRKKFYSAISLLCLFAICLTVAVFFAACDGGGEKDPDDQQTTVTEYTVTFDTDGGTSVASQQVESGKTVSKPEDPQKAHYEFKGWYSDSARETEYVFSTPVTSNITIYAKWEYIPATNTLTYGENTLTVTEGENFTIPAPAAESGYEFIGWFAGGEQLTDETGTSLSVWGGEGDAAVEARFEVILTYETASDGKTLSVSGSEASAHLTELVIPAYHDGVAVTEVSGFNGYTSLVSVSIPSTVKEINYLSFTNSPSLKEYVIYEVEGEEPAFVSDGGVLFSADRHTLVLYPIAKEDTSYTVPASVTVIADGAFYGQTYGDYRMPEYYGPLTELVLSSNLQSIGAYAFYQRGALKTVKFANDKSNVEWSVGDYAFAGHLLETFPFGSNLISVGKYAFQGINMIKTASLPGELTLYSGIKTIAEGAFNNCDWMTAVVIPSSVTSLGAEAFGGCGKLASVTFEEGYSLSVLPDGVFNYCPIAEVALPGCVTSIGAEAFANCYKMTAISLPAGLKSIGESAFDGCSSIVSLTLPEGLERIGDSAFANMSALTKINIPASVTSFGSSVFSGCDALDLDNVDTSDSTLIRVEDGVMYNADMTELVYYPANKTDTSYVMPDTVKTIPQEVFSYNQYLTSVTLSKSLESIPTGAFYYSKITSIEIPASVKRIEAEAFYNCRSLSSITFAEGSALTFIGDYAFYGAVFPSIDLPETITSIGESAFASCKELRHIEFPDSVSIFGASMLRWCEKLESVVLPKGLTSLPDLTFDSCYALKSLELPAGITHIGEGAIVNTLSLASITISAENTAYKSVDGNLYTKDGKTLVLYAIGKDEESFKVPDGVTEIAASAFMINTNLSSSVAIDTKLKSVDLNGVTVIGDYAFYKLASLQTIDLSKVVTIGSSAFNASGITAADLSSAQSIGSYAFSGCSALTSVKFGAITHIPVAAFRSCSLLTSVDLSAVESIGENAFYGCSSLAAVTFGNSLLSIGEDSFEGTALTAIVLPSSLEELGDAFSVKTLQTVTVDSQAALNAICEGVANESEYYPYGLTRYASVIRVKEGLDLPEGGIKGFTAGQAQDGYVVYTKDA